LEQEILHPHVRLKALAGVCGIWWAVGCHEKNSGMTPLAAAQGCNEYNIAPPKLLPRGKTFKAVGSSLFTSTLGLLLCRFSNAVPHIALFS